MLTDLLTTELLSPYTEPTFPRRTPMRPNMQIRSNEELSKKSTPFNTNCFLNLKLHPLWRNISWQDTRKTNWAAISAENFIWYSAPANKNISPLIVIIDINIKCSMEKTHVRYERGQTIHAVIFPVDMSRESPKNIIPGIEGTEMIKLWHGRKRKYQSVNIKQEINKIEMYIVDLHEATKSRNNRQ